MYQKCLPTFWYRKKLGPEVSLSESEDVGTHMSEDVGTDSENRSVAMPGYVDFEDFFCRVGNAPVSLRSARYTVERLTPKTSPIWATVMSFCS